MLRSVKYGLSGAVVAGLVGGAVALTTTEEKTVRLAVDGHVRIVHTEAGSVGAVLASQHLAPTSHDLVAPMSSSAVRNGQTIVVRHGRLLRLSVDGKTQDVWTTAPTVSVAMSDLGFSTSDFTSVSRSQRLPLAPTDIDVRTPKSVTLIHDGTTSTVTTTDATVGQVLSELSVDVRRYDRLSAPTTAAITDGMRIRLTRVTHGVVTQNKPIPFAMKSTKDKDLPTGDTKITTAGHPGVEQLRWAVVYVDGKLVGKTPMSPQVVEAAIARVRAIGTQIADPGSYEAIAQAMMAKDYGWGSDQLSCVTQMWTRESNWSTSASNASGAYGIPQALPGSKMASAGPDWETNPATQIRWGLGYIKERYSTPCGAWGFWQAHGYY